MLQNLMESSNSFLLNFFWIWEAEQDYKGEESIFLNVPYWVTWLHEALLCFRNRFEKKRGRDSNFILTSAVWNII